MTSKKKTSQSPTRLNPTIPPAGFDSGVEGAIAALMARTVEEVEESTSGKGDYWKSQKMESEVVARISAFKTVFGEERTSIAVVSSGLFVTCLVRGMSNCSKTLVEEFGSRLFGFWTLSEPDPVLGSVAGPVGLSLLSSLDFLVDPLVSRECPMTEREAALCAHRMPAFVLANHHSIQKCVIMSGRSEGPSAGEAPPSV